MWFFYRECLGLHPSALQTLKKAHENAFVVSTRVRVTTRSRCIVSVYQLGMHDVIDFSGFAILSIADPLPSLVFILQGTHTQ